MDTKIAISPVKLLGQSLVVGLLNCLMKKDISTDVTVERPVGFTVNHEESPAVASEVMEALGRILLSASFVQSSRLCSFLRYAVEETLAGRADAIKEYTIGTNAYGRKQSFDPSQDTIVRSEARRLRKKLLEYYESEGLHENIIIFFRSGSYVPVIRSRSSLENDNQNGPIETPKLWTSGDGIWVEMTRFETAPLDGGASSFAFGLSAEIVHRLLRVPGVRVLWKEPQATVGEFAEGQKEQAPQAQVIIGGSVRSDSDCLRVHAHIATPEGHLLWSQRYDIASEHDALMELQESIASAFLGRIAPRQSIVKRHVATPTKLLLRLYSDVLAAETLLEEGSTEGLQEALDRFERLTFTAPYYARLYCGISQCCIGLTHRGVSIDPSMVARATQAARKAISLDPDVVEGHSSLGCALAQEWSWGAAEASFRKGVDLGRQHTVHRQFGMFLLILRRFDEAWEHLQISQSLDPFSKRQKSSIARFFFCTQRDQEAQEQALQQNDSWGVLPLEASYFRALSALQRSDASLALQAAQALVKVPRGIPSYIAAAAELFSLAGDLVKAKKLCEENHLLDQHAKIGGVRQALLSMALGDSTQALDFLRASLKNREPDLPWANSDPRFTPLHTDDGFKNVISAIFAGQENLRFRVSSHLATTAAL